MTRTFIDTSFLLALAAEDDELHARAAAWQRTLRGTVTNGINLAHKLFCHIYL